MTATYSPEVQRLYSQPHDPWLGVHELSQYTFCARAGLNTTRQELVDCGQDENHVGPLDFEPEYEVDAIDRMVYVYSGRVFTWAVAVLVLAIVTVTWATRHGNVPWLVSILLAIMSLAFAVSDGLQLLFWFRQKWHSMNGVDRLPDLASAEVEPLNWWQLFRADFVSVSTSGGLRDDDLQLAGQPFKLLKRGDQYIPVFLRRGESTQIYSQHYVRMAAYCLLLQRQTGGNAPFGILLTAGTFECVAIKFNRETFDLLSQRLLDARRVIREYDQLEQQPPPPQRGLCRKCPFGRAIPVNSEASLILRKRTGITPRGHIAGDGRRYHCHCGDQFEWTPPHQTMVELGIPH